MKTIELTDLFFEGQVSIERVDGWLKPWRVPCDKKALFPSPGDTLLGRMETCAGVRLRFKTNSANINVEAKVADQGLFDLTIEQELIQTSTLEADENVVCFSDLPKGEKIVEIWFPQGQTVSVRTIEIDEGCDAVIVPDERLKWVTYGSSITHCSSAYSPSRTWPATAARKHNLNLTCLGYGGNCHLEPMVARMIRDLPADLITLKLGINVQGGSTLSPRTFKAAIIGLVEIIREKHPETPIGIMSPIVSPHREKEDNIVGLSLEKMRVEVEDAVKRIRETDGDDKLFYLTGLEIFGHDLVGERLPDNLHPNGEGYEILGHNVADKLLPTLLKNI